MGNLKIWFLFLGNKLLLLYSGCKIAYFKKELYSIQMMYTWKNFQEGHCKIDR